LVGAGVKFGISKVNGMKNIKRINLQLIKRLLPWIAAVVTELPYSNQRSRFLDRLIDFVEN
jgi:hypothetical protein